MTGRAYAELKRLTAEAARHGWSAFGIDRDDTPTQSALIEEAIRLLHNPPPDADAQALIDGSHPAWRRVKFDELLAQQLSMRLHYERRNRVRAHPLLQHSKMSRALLAALAFRLTRAQTRVLTEIRTDLTRPHPMQRLLQGDVGSGKTIVAALAALQAIESGYQAAREPLNHQLKPRGFLNGR